MNHIVYGTEVNFFFHLILDDSVTYVSLMLSAKIFGKWLNELAGHCCNLVGKICDEIILKQDEQTIKLRKDA